MPPALPQAQTPAPAPQTGVIPGGRRAAGGGLKEYGAVGAPAATAKSGWEAATEALNGLAMMPEDEGRRRAAAACLARLGLRTAALELDEELESARGMAEDRISSEERIAMCRGNVRALGGRTNLGERLEKWAEGAIGTEWFRANDGNVVHRDRGAPPPVWSRLADDRSAAARAAEGVGAGMVIEGLRSPWFLEACLRRLPAAKDGSVSTVTVIAPSAEEALDALSLVDLREMLASPGVRVWAGEEGAERAHAEGIARLEFEVDAKVVSTPGQGTHATWRGAPIERLWTDLSARRSAALRDSLARTQALYGARTQAWWKGRYEAALASGSPEPLRVLVPTCRFSTFVQHSAQDLAEALRLLGCDVRVLIEPDSTARLTSLAYAKTIAEYQPDLVILINYTRANMNAGAGVQMIPASLPVVCWMQDPMEHLFRAEVGASQGAMDFLVGHLHSELAERFGYSTARRMAMPVTVCTRKFFRPARFEAKSACEVAFISHHSEPPQVLHARLVAEAGAPRVQRLMEDLRPELEGLARGCGDHALAPAIRTLVRERGSTALGTLDARTEALLCNQYAFPVVDRMIRHETLGWARDICTRRGWRLRIHGRGWESVDGFREFGAGELLHGEALRDAYAGALVTLHASAHWSYHQRVMECALSGGMPLVRRKRDDLDLLSAYVVGQLSGVMETGCFLNAERTPWYWPAEHASAMRRHAMLQSLGHEFGRHAILKITPAMVAEAKRAWSSLPMHDDAAWLLGDWRESTFGHAAELEACLERFTESAERRTSVSQGTAARVRAFFSMDAAAEGMVSLVRSGLAGA